MNRVRFIVFYHTFLHGDRRVHSGAVYISKVVKDAGSGKDLRLEIFIVALRKGLCHAVTVDP